MSKGWGQAAEFAQFLHPGWIVKCFTAVSVARLETKARLQRQIWIIEEKPRRQIWKLWQEMRQCWPNYPPPGQLAPKSANWVNEGKKCLITSKHKNLKTVRKLRICQMKCCFVNVFMGYSKYMKQKREVSLCALQTNLYEMFLSNEKLLFCKMYYVFYGWNKYLEWISEMAFI